MNASHRALLLRRFEKGAEQNFQEGRALGRDPTCGGERRVCLTFGVLSVRLEEGRQKVLNHWGMRAALWGQRWERGIRPCGHVEQCPKTAEDANVPLLAFQCW